MSIDDSPAEKQKSSGVTVCTGTGSTSWFFHINHILSEDVKNILNIGEFVMLVDFHLFPSFVHLKNT